MEASYATGAAVLAVLRARVSRHATPATVSCTVNSIKKKCEHSPASATKLEQLEGWSALAGTDGGRYLRLDPKPHARILRGRVLAALRSTMAGVARVPNDQLSIAQSLTDE